MNKLGLFLEWSYKLDNHYLGQVSLRNSLWFPIVLFPALALFKQTSWWIAALVSITGILLYAGVAIAKKRGYLIFEPSPLERVSVAQTPLKADEQIHGWASGRVAVAGNEKLVLGEKAQLLFVPTREHIVMVKLERTRFLLLARSSRGEEGWWYAFIKPKQVLKVETGRIAHGLKTRPALALTYRSGEKAGQKETLYFACAGVAGLWRIIDDLRIDVAPHAFHV